jgi:hypothetical protein
LSRPDLSGRWVLLGPRVLLGLVDHLRRLHQLVQWARLGLLVRSRRSHQLLQWVRLALLVRSRQSVQRVRLGLPVLEAPLVPAPQVLLEGLEVLR